MAEQKQAKVMLVEDDFTMRSVLKTLLEIEGFQIVTTSGREMEEELLSLIRQNQPDVVLLDVHLPNASSFNVMQEIRSDPALQETRVVMTSGMDMKDESLRAGANSFLLKPYMPDELIQLLKG